MVFYTSQINHNRDLIINAHLSLSFWALKKLARLSLHKSSNKTLEIHSVTVVSAQPGFPPSTLLGDAEPFRVALHALPLLRDICHYPESPQQAPLFLQKQFCKSSHLSTRWHLASLRNSIPVFFLSPSLLSIPSFWNCFYRRNSYCIKTGSVAFSHR